MKQSITETADKAQSEAFAELIAESERQLRLLAALTQRSPELAGETTRSIASTRWYPRAIQGMAYFLLVLFGSVAGALIVNFGMDLV